MKLEKALLVGIALGVAAAMGLETNAHACGGCFQVPTESPTVVTDHRMIFSISKEQSTLYDQIRYSGDPSSFAWVLPFAGDIEVGVSSDRLFGLLDSYTQTVITGPPSSCPPPPCFGSSGGSSSSSSGSSGTSGVIVLHNEVVGPYETVQLKATDPSALDKWLTAHGYAIPESVKPVVAAYQSENFNFLAMKLVPGQGVKDMKPVRVTTKGASVALPLRMVAAGTGATVGITLWVVAEARYAPQNFGSFVVTEGELTWSFATQRSDYTEIRAAKTAAGKGRAWETESSELGVASNVRSSLGYQSTNVSGKSMGYEDQTGDAGAITLSAEQARDRDLDVLLAGIPEGKDHVTRLRADLAHDALDQDLVLEASSDPRELTRYRYVSKSVGAPVCPSYGTCPPGSSSSGDGGSPGNSIAVGGGDGDEGCQASPSNRSLPWLGAMIAGGLLVASRRRSGGGRRRRQDR